MRFVIGVAVLVTAICSGYAKDEPQTSRVRVVAVPLHGILPDAKLDAGGVLHIVFMTGDDVLYAASRDLGATFSQPIRVNDRAGSAMGGMFRGPELALGDRGAIHVTWYNRAMMQRKGSSVQPGVMYARRSGEGTFEASRNLTNAPSDGHSIAAHGENVVVAWHDDDTLRLAVSKDGGGTFSPTEKLRALPCECCDTALVLPDPGTAYLAYRDRTDDRRDMFLAAIGLGRLSETHRRLDVQSWKIKACPTSGAGLAHHAGRLDAAWERDGSILLAQANGADLRGAPPAVVGQGKFPVVLANGASRLVAWKHGERLHWQVYEKASLTLLESGTAASRSAHRPAGVAAPTGDRYVLLP